jgi:hypothetical protein
MGEDGEVPQSGTQEWMKNKSFGRLRSRFLEASFNNSRITRLRI